jgi:hypothetical protein
LAQAEISRGLVRERIAAKVADVLGVARYASMIYA